MAWPTAQTVVVQAALELGLIQSSSAWGDDVYASTDSTVAQMLALLKKAGRDLVDEAWWSHLRAEYSLTTVQGTFGASPHQRIGAYPLPPDWRAMIDQSGWNRTTRLPMGGPLSEQEWQYLASRLTGVVWTVLFKPMQGLLYLYPPASVPVDQEVTFAYKSSYWVQPSALVAGTDYVEWGEGSDYEVGTIVLGGAAGGTYTRNVYRCVQNGQSAANGPDTALSTTGIPTMSGTVDDGTVQWNWIGVLVITTNAIGNEQTAPSFGTRDVPEAGSDLLMFDEGLLVAKLKLLWLDAKGFDTSSAEGEYARQFMQASSNDSPAPILSLNRGGIVRDRLLDGLNVPITGFGS